MNRFLMTVAFVVIILGSGMAAASLASGKSLSVVASSVSADCSAWPTSCTVTALVDNTGTGGFASPFTAYFVYTDSLGQTVLIDQKPWSATQSLVSDSGLTPQSVPGAGSSFLGFTVTVFFWDANGAPMGVSTAKSFSVPLHFTIDYVGVGTIAVSPPGSGVTTGSVSSLAGGQYYAAYWPAGTVLTVTTSAGVAPVTTAPSGGSDCPASQSGSGFVCTVKASELTGTPIIEGAGASSLSQQIIYIGNEASGGSPASVCLSATAYQTGSPIYGDCTPTGSFAIAVPAGYTWSGDLWSLVEQGSATSVLSGNTTTVSLSYSALAPKVSFSGGVSDLLLTQGSLVPSSQGNGNGDGNGSSMCTLNPSTNAGLDVFVTNQAGSPVKGAMVVAGGASAVTDAKGYALLCNFPVPQQGTVSSGQGTVAVSVQAQGYSPKSQTAGVIEGQTTTATVQLSGGGFSDPYVLAGFGVAAVGAAVAFAAVALGRRRP
ncbi:MAG: hypothetical protein JRM80_11530 [Nitrososphaerota archaeon]|jgi:hypothetical protein|nr:hypothetical protein [Nitrososphaerota archaeon]MDG7029520.1 hypothetical protein [Nitrososphaerota archaeon]